MNQLLFIFFVTLSLAVKTHAAPSNISVSGTLVSGESVIVSGTGFLGALPATEFVGGTIEATTEGQIPTKTSWSFDLSGANVDPIVTTNNCRSGAKCIYQNIGAMSGGMYYYTHPTNIGYDQTLMVSYWVRRHRTGVSDYQWKLFRFGYSPNSYIDSYTPQIKWFEHDASYDQFYVSPGPGTNAVNGGPPYPEDYLKTTYPSVDDRWYRIDIIVHTSSTQGASDGWYTHRLYDPVGGTISEHTNPAVNTFNTGVNDFYKYFFWQNWMETSALTSHQLWTDDMHIQVGGQQRIELCNTTEWSARTSCDIQPVTSWSGTGATIAFNAGGFSVGQTAYLYVIDANGDVNATGFPVTLGVQNQLYRYLSIKADGKNLRWIER